MATSTDEPKKKRKKPDLPIIEIKNTSDYQRMKLDRLMANIDKPVTIPVKPREKNLPPPPDFVRNIMGSSAGAGSGEFHVYRHLRRKEYARQKTILEQGKLEEQEAEFKRKLEEKQKIADEKTAKKREKRLKKKAARQRNKVKGKPNSASKASDSSDSESDDNDPGSTSEVNQKSDDTKVPDSVNKDETESASQSQPQAQQIEEAAAAAKSEDVNIQLAS